MAEGTVMNLLIDNLTWFITDGGVIDPAYKEQVSKAAVAISEWHEAELAAREAQAAEMIETLEYVESHFENLADGNTFFVTPSTDQAWNKVREALSAAQKEKQS